MVAGGLLAATDGPAAPLVIETATEDPSATATNTPQIAPTLTPTPVAMTIEKFRFGHYQQADESRIVTWAAVFTNPISELSAERLNLDARFYDAEGDLVGRDGDNVRLVLPGQTTAEGSDSVFVDA